VRVAEKAELHVTIGVDGVVRVKTHGLKGQVCLAETKDVEAALGRVTRRERTPEYYQQDAKAKTGVKNR
jgi:hypothetical protein